MKLKMHPHLIDDENSALAGKTHAGMAHFAGTGPSGKTCRQCSRYGFEGYKKTDRSLKMASCAKGLGPKFTHEASACKYFDENPKPHEPFLKESAANA